MGDYLFTIPLVVEKNLAVAKIKRENEELRMEVELALAQVREKNTQLEQSLKKVEEMAATDALTGLYNRRHFGKALEQCFAEAQRYEKDLSCLMIDLDSYKKLNDTYGHQVGDQLLILAGRVITANKRVMDIAARYGGDEFVLLLPHAGAEEAAVVAGRIAEEFFRSSATLLKRDASMGVTMSIGIGSLKANRPVHADQLLSFADAALYQSKEAGRNRVSVCDDSRNAA
jgi:diguanylate cyclase (GGDEF)-like protein